MKNFQQNLLISLALGLCGLCAFQWYQQTLQRNEITTLNGMVYEKNVAFQDATNSIALLNHQVEQMDARLTPRSRLPPRRMSSWSCSKKLRLAGWNSRA